MEVPRHTTRPAIRHLLFGAVIALLPATVLAQDAPMTSPWASGISQYAEKSLDNPHALGVAAVPLNGPGSPQFVNADTLMTPGSIMKLVTTYAALELLGPNYTWDTDILTDGSLQGDTLKGNLYVRFGGDPKLTLERLWSVLGDLHGMGISRVEGDLVLDGSYFRLAAGETAFDDNGDNPYAPFLVEPSGYLTNLNLQQFQAVADERGSRAWSKPALPAVGIDNQLNVGPPGTCPGRDSFKWQPGFHADGTVTVTVTGTLPRGCATDAYLSLLPPQRYAASLTRTLLAASGVAIAGTDRVDFAPEDARLLLKTTSPDLATMVRDINKWSSNVMARQLLLCIGAESRSEDGARDDRASGIAAIRGWLEAKGIDTRGMVLDNGAGLSREGRISARQGVQLLQHAWNSPYATDLMASMPIIAMDGTMARRLRNTGLEGLGRIKTGSLDNVRSIAGFARDDHDTTWAVVAIVNSMPAWNGQAVLDHVLYTLHFRPPTEPSVTQAAPDARSEPPR